ncbi:adenosinetriphosphatase [Exophiala viscosa]|uniref:adenosinetriphosphatase n=1 Tax=Exophiala viscosa TaxID=2486360 RepID=UPI0021965609|nr:adenosinetriphosphatase [Exophiala viscosa]
MDRIEVDISSWLGKPPEKSKNTEKDTGEDAEETLSQQSKSPVGDAYSSSDSDDNGDIEHSPENDIPVTVSDEDEDSVRDTTSRLQHNFYIDIPRLSREEKEAYEYLPGHFSVQRVLSKLEDGKYLIKRKSGERDLVSARELRALDNGSSSLQEFQELDASGQNKRRSVKQAASGMVDWTTMDISDTGEDEPSAPHRRRTSGDDSEVTDVEMRDEAETEEEGDSDIPQEQGRRSARLTSKRKFAHLKEELVELDDDSDQPRARRERGRKSAMRPNRGSMRTLRARGTRARVSDTSPEVVTRRSERTRTQPHRSMRERQEDEISSLEEEKSAPKVVGAKEHFARIPDHDPFRKRHRQDCDTCNWTSDNPSKGPLVFCQGCTNSYHKSCLGPRGSRDHLVTKVGEGLFVLQCRRCIGLSQEKHNLAPHQGRCADCNELGACSRPLRNRLTSRQEQAQREENGGTDPITIVEPDMLNNITHVMFRCAQCNRAWHMHHLPQRKTAHSSLEAEDEEMLDEVELAQKRFEHYHRSWTCKDCIENQHQIDALVAWRPVNLEAYAPGTVVDQVPEIEKEYLVKWRAQSYFRTTWMPGTWVWGIAAGQMRLAFMKKPENQLPKMTTADAIPEEVFRVDIVFDVRYSSVVRNSTKEIDLARVKEVELAFVKYKGLGYEDAIWEKPPTYADTERWNDFKLAYEDYVNKLHVSIPPQSTLRRHLIHVRALDFSTNIIKKTQPSAITGGELMQYQLEGLNWLLFQWYQNQNAVLADEMGLGKTIQLISFFATLVHDHKCWPFLVVVPNATCPNWRREIKKWAPSLTVVTYYGSSVARKLAQDYELFPKDKDDEEKRKQKKSRSEVKDIKAHLVVTSYEAIVEDSVRKNLMRVPWQGLIVDEGQRLKGDKTQIYDSLSKFRFPFKVLLTGTPLQNNARELFNLLQFLDKNMNAAELEIKYANLTQENVPELHETLRKFFLRRTKAQVLTFLPPMAQVIVPVSMSSVQKKVYKSILARNPQLMRSIFAREGAVAPKERANLNNILMQLRKTLCHPFVYSRDIEERTVDTTVAFQNLVGASGKLHLLSIMLPKLFERGHRVLMFSQFLDNLDIIEDFLDGLGLQHRRLDGTISAAEKQKRIDEFNAPDSPYFAFLLSTRAGGVGINLATADTVILLDPDFNPHQDIQALSRAHRIGQKHKVLVFQLMVRDSVEEKIMQIGRKKMALDHVLIERMGREDDAGEDLESILRHGAQALFEGDSEADDIVYDSASVDRLLDRSQIEDTKTSEEKSAESQFSFARVWANDKSTLEEDLADTGTSTPNPGIWDKILQERERTFAEEQARKAEAFGRGKRKRQTVDYGGIGDGDPEDKDKDKDKDKLKAKRGPKRVDPDYQEPADIPEEEDNLTAEDTDVTPKRTVKARPFKRVRVPLGQAPHFNGDAAFDFGPVHSMPPPHLCSACGESHPMGWCRLKVAGVEHCGLCGIAHLGHGRTCPHVNDNKQVAILLQTLKESTESRELIEQATKYLRSIRGDLMQRERARELRELQAIAQDQRPTNMRPS